MKRKDFIRGSGLAGLGLAFTSSKLFSSTRSKWELSDDCALIPSEVAGPFPLDLEESDAFFRQDIRENEQGVTLNLKLKILGLDNCQPMPNVRVNIWHCNKDGVYSGYDTGSNPGDPEGTHLRGYQFTDANGVAESVTSTSKSMLAARTQPFPNLPFR